MTKAAVIQRLSKMGKDYRVRGYWVQVRREHRWHPLISVGMAPVYFGWIDKFKPEKRV